jgi:hypothetical protein
MSYNDYVYETFGISKHLPVKLHKLLIIAKMFDNPLTAKCFIYDVMGFTYLEIKSSTLNVKMYSFIVSSIFSGKRTLTSFPIYC